MGGNALAILLISWFQIRRDTSAIFRELRFSHAQRLDSSRQVQDTLRKPPLPIPKGNSSPSGIEARGNLECAVNVPYRRNWPSTFSHFCNPGDTFRASVFCG